VKPLELTVYPKSRGMFGAQYDLADGRHMLAREGADVLSRNKRFTDAELAAEMQSAVFHEAECEVRGLRLVMRNPDHPGIDHYSHWNREFGRRATILERFATLPHYDEAAL
jgi:hypothetical protein